MHFFAHRLIFIAAFCPLGAFAQVALRLDDSVAGFTTSTAALNPATAPAIGDNDNQWGFSNATTSSNNQAAVGAGNPETVNLAGYAFGSRVDLGENAPAFDTVVSGLSIGISYEVYAYFVGNNQNWGIQAGLNGGGLVYYDKASPGYSAAGGILMDSSGSSELHRVLIGTVSGVESFTVNFDDNAGLGLTNNPRSFIKGIGIKAILGPPPPAGNAAGRPIRGNGHAIAATWGTPNVPADFDAHGLSYSSAPHSLFTEPGRAVFDFAPGAEDSPLTAPLDTRTNGAFAGLIASEKIGAPGTSLYFSVLLRFPSGPAQQDLAVFALSSFPGTQPWDGTEVLRFGKLAGSDHLSASLPGGGTPFDTGLAPDGGTHLLVGRIDFTSGTDSVRLWLDPTLPLGENHASQVTPFAIGSAELSFAGYHFRGNSPFEADEVRFGDTWNSVLPLADSDLDGLPDAWELRWRGDLSPLPGDDPDGDGFTNEQEAAAGTNPFDPSSRPATSLNPPARQLSWISAQGHYYRVEESTDLSTWFPLGNDVIGDGGEFLIDLPDDFPSQFYRLLVSSKPIPSTP
jgi:hypothetical protein